ncbi:MAG: UDP-2,3-diacylglucosamine diphosphatase [Imperialibacter sp.]|uniref:UDP-2,3-diacylglucosamine diphosphatase n=1 Tax=Imperialibacter sp. TaxID=2038411 RepID=UPI0032EC8E3D
MQFDNGTLPDGKLIYFASDFHLGAPNQTKSRERENKVVKWLGSIEDSAAAIFLVGDIFDFWFEYNHVIPKGFARFQGKIAELIDKDIPVIFFSGNHDMWMANYFTEEFGIPVYHENKRYVVNGVKLLVGHGDGLGPGDYRYKFLKKIFRNKLCRWAFKWLHPNVGMAIAHKWSSNSRISNLKYDEAFLGDDEWLWTYCKEIEAQDHHDYYIFGHRHLPLDLEVGKSSRYINLGEWINHCTYAVFDGEKVELKRFE